MAGNPNNVTIWAEADVYVLFPSDIPSGQTLTDMLPAGADAEWPAEWAPAGLLNGDAGFEESSEWDETEHSAWGYGVIKVGYKDYKMTRKFTTLEENPTVARLRSKNDTATRVKVSKPTDAYLGFETRDGEGKVKRRITTVPSSVKYGGATENESDLPEVEFEAKIFPNDQKELFIKQESGQLSTRTATITVVGTPTGGTFKLQIADEETVAIAYNAAATAVKAAIEGLNAVDGTANVTGSAGGPYAVTYTATGDLEPGDNSLTGGTSPHVTVA